MDWLSTAFERAGDAAGRNDINVGVVFVTPHVEPGVGEAESASTADEFISASREVRSSGCAFSFPDSHELARYRYGNRNYPGAVLLVQAFDPSGNVST